MTDAYPQHLAALHARFEAPPQLIAAAAREVTRSPLVRAERIVHGEANEVYALAFESGLEVILRIARAGGDFAKEAWAIGRCRALGMAVPEVLSLQRRATEGQVLEVCILEKLPGERLLDRLSMPRETLRSVVGEVGDQISRMHAIGPGDLGDGARFFEDDVDAFLPTAPQFLELGAKARLDLRRLEQVFRRYETMIASSRPSPRRLIHNDLRACHVLVHDGRLSGVIDFGQVAMDSPISELARWAHWEEPALPLAWLQEGYGDKRLFDDDYAGRLAVYRVVNALWVLRWCATTGYASGADLAAARIGAYLAEFAAG